MSNEVIRWPGSFGDDARRAASEHESEPLPAWFDMNTALRGLPDELNGDLLRLLGHVFDEQEPDGSGDWASDLDDGSLWNLVDSCRRGLVRASDRTAAAAIQRAHGRLDAMVRGAVRGRVRRDAIAQRRLIGEVSHDLRSPLNSILFLADALRTQQSGELNEVQERQVNVLFTAAVTLVKMVNDLIDFGQLADNRTIRVASVSFSVENVLQDVESLVAPLAGHRRAQLSTHIGVDGPRLGDSQLLVRVLLNLASNAVQSVDDGGLVTIEVDETENGWLRMKVTDNAVGTDVEFLRRRIEAAGSVPTETETRGWTHGLGLAISAQLVEAAGGTLTVETVQGEGTVFSVIVPFATA